MPRIERASNLVLGLTVLSWSVLALLQPCAVPRLVVAALNAVVGAMLIVRAPLAAAGPASALVLSVPGVAVAGVALGLAAPVERWPWFSEALLAAGGALAAISFLFLGRSFAVLPALRGVVTGGPYRLVRHPAYLGELAMVAACAIARPWWATALAAVAAVPLVLLRIRFEERLLVRDPRYAAYAARVRFRLLPGLW